MTGTDPAIAAAERWWAEQGATEQERENSVDCWSEVAQGSAREALAPIRAWYLRFDPGAPLNESMDDLVRLLWSDDELTMHDDTNEELNHD